jgi:hypothetical protein
MVAPVTTSDLLSPRPSMMSMNSPTLSYSASTSPDSMAASQAALSVPKSMYSIRSR